MIKAFKEGMVRYADFNGVSSRSQYWYFTLAYACIGFIVGLLGAFTAPEAASVVLLLINVIVFIPSLAIGVRRLHDSDHSGWWILFPVVGFIMLFFATKPNRYSTPAA